MLKAWWLLFITTILGVWNAGIVWFTQIAVYALWPFVGADKFHDYHLAWWRDMWPSFGPVVVMFGCSIALLWIRPRGMPVWVLWLGLLLQVAVHTLTAFQATMATAEGMSLIKYQELMNTHWFRVAFFFAYALLMIWVFQSFNRGRFLHVADKETSLLQSSGQREVGMDGTHRERAPCFTNWRFPVEGTEYES